MSSRHPRHDFPVTDFRFSEARAGIARSRIPFFPFSFSFFSPSSSNWLSESRLLWRLPRHWSTSSGRLLWEPRRAGNQGQQRCGGRKKRERGAKMAGEQGEDWVYISKPFLCASPVFLVYATTCLHFQGLLCLPVVSRPCVGLFGVQKKKKYSGGWAARGAYN